MPSSLLLTGGTGRLGRRVLPLLLDAGHTIRVLSRRERDPQPGVEFAIGDLDTGQGIAEAAAGATTIVHCAGTDKGDDHKARTLVSAVTEAGGVEHLINISVVGADRVPVESRIDRAMFEYMAAQHRAEKVVAQSGLPWTTLRATQFHDLLLTMAKRLAQRPVVLVPSLRFQPVDVGDVAIRLAELVSGPPAGLVPDIAGPHVYSLPELLRTYVRATNQRRLLIPVWVPGKAARAFRAGANLAPEHAVGRMTWEEFLADRLGQPHTERVPF